MNNMKERSVAMHAIWAVVIKELRQELRMRSFAVLFLLPQVAMSLLLLLELGNDQNYAGSSSIFGTFVWVIIGLPLYVLIPKRAHASISKEGEANILEVMFLTKISAWQLVFGKWLSIVLISLLFVCSILPYLLLGYYLGDKDIFGTLQIVWWMLYGSLLLSAFSLSASAGRGGKRGSIFLSILGLIVVYLLSQLARVFGRGASSAFSLLGTEEFVILAIVGLFAVLLLVESGVTRIASLLENYVLRKRTLSLLVMGLLAIFIELEYGNPDLNCTLLFLALVLICLTSLFEELHPYLKRELKRTGSVGIKIFVYPGWPGAVMFCLLLSLFSILIIRLHESYEAPLVAMVVSLWGTLLMPLAIMKIFLPKSLRTAFSYSVIQGVLVMLSMGSFSSGQFISAYRLIFSSTPLGAFSHMLFDSNVKSYAYAANAYSNQTSMTVVVGITVLSALVLYRDYSKLRGRTIAGVVDVS